MMNPTVEEFVKSTMKMLHQICKEQHRNIWDNYDLFAPNGWEMDTE